MKFGFCGIIETPRVSALRERDGKIPKLSKWRQSRGCHPAAPNGSYLFGGYHVYTSTNFHQRAYCNAQKSHYAYLSSEEGAWRAHHDAHCLRLSNSDGHGQGWSRFHPCRRFAWDGRAWLREHAPCHNGGDAPSLPGGGAWSEDRAADRRYAIYVVSSLGGGSHA